MGRAIAYARKGDKIHAAADLAEALKYDPDARTSFEEYGLPFDEPAAQPATSQLSGN
jgi:Tfp pilus assembly protein PilF